MVVSINTNQKISLSSFSVPVLEDWHIAESKIVETKKESEDKWKSQILLTVVPLNIGELTFPSLFVPYYIENLRPETLQTPLVKVTVVPIITGAISPERLKDIKPPVSVGGKLLYWTILFLLFSVGLIIWIILKHKKTGTKITVESIPTTPPAEIALEKLKSVMRLYKQNGDFRMFYIELSNIFREYLSVRYAMDALEKTTSEIFSDMRRKELPRTICLEVKEILSSCDLVKFAKFVPPEKQLEEDYAKTEGSVMRTREKIIEPTPSNSIEEKNIK
ncbi:MAG: hypothetical protein LHV69_11200 [Elusimicrobia bacterium]|nr:hypothetical protein [Candidatus Obscuribacterium magneticum]